MCRWLAYSGGPLHPSTLLLDTKYSLIDQSLHSRLGATTTNGDGFGLGWYKDDLPAPALFKSIEPAWNDRNLRELSTHLSSSLFFAHIRASTGSPVQQTNCHPFRSGRWLFMHNGSLGGFINLKRDLIYAVDPLLYQGIEGSTDSEAFFALALTFGLREDPVAGMSRAVGFIEDVARKHDVPHAVQMTVAVSDGTTIWAFRYATEDTPRSLFVSDAVGALRMLYPDAPLLATVTDEARVVVSEPITDLEGVFVEVEPSTVLIVQPGEDVTRPFAPTSPG